MYLSKKLSKNAGEHVEWDAERVQQLLDASLETDSIVCLVLEDSSSEICGLLLGCITEAPTARVRIAAEIGFYVETTGFARWDKLIKAYEDWAQSQGVYKIMISEAHGKLKSPSRIFEKMGYTKSETLYYRSL